MNTDDIEDGTFEDVGEKPATPRPDSNHKTAKKRPRPSAKSLDNLKPHGPGRPKGSRNRFNQAAISNFVNQYRSDLAVDWEKHGDKFIARCREEFPQVYATMQRMRIEDELRAQPDTPQHITISWKTHDDGSQPPVGKASEPPRLIAYQKPQLPGDLTEHDWSLLMDVLELIKRTVPTNDERPPAEVLGVLKEALLAHFRDK